MAIGRAAWQLAMEISPIFLQGGRFASMIPGDMIPIILATEIINFPLGILSSGKVPSLEESFAHFQPMAGAMALNQQIATYPFANAEVAANSVMQQPLQISYQMTCPARGKMGYWAKLAKMTVLLQVLKEHNETGGRYALITPSFVYFDCLMRTMRDASSGQTKQVQNVWVLDFEKPLVTVTAARVIEQKLSGILDKITGGQRVASAPSPTSLFGTVGAANPTSTPLPVPAAQVAIPR